MQQNLQFDDKLSQEWSDRLEDHPSLFRVNLKFKHMRQISDSPFFVYFNQQLVENKREPQITFHPVLQETDVSPLVQDFNEEAFNFSKVLKEEILFYIDLDEEEVVLQRIQNEIDDEDSYKFEHALLINSAPVCYRHCLLAPYINEQLPQVLGGELLQLVLNTFSMSKKNSLRIGYNSIGGFASVNHMHFQLLYAEDLFPEYKVFPIERFPRQILFENGLKSRFNQESMYNIGIRVSQIKGYPVRTYVVQPHPFPSEPEQVAECYMTLAFIIQLMIEKLLNHKIAHNIMIADDGLTIYVFPRQHQQLHSHNHHMKPAWLEICGLAVSRDKQYYDSLTAEMFEEFMQNHCSLGEQAFLKFIKDLEFKLKEKFD